jgi:hypothetical protein
MLCALTGVSVCNAQPVYQSRMAEHRLGFSGATVAIQESHSHHKWPVSDRTFILTGANGRVQKLMLHEGGGSAGNNSLNLYQSRQDRFLIVSERDCIEFDPVSVKAAYCKTRPPCRHGSLDGPTYLGRFDWMNGFDSPKGDFRFDFRFGPFEDAAESGACPHS